MVKKMSDDDVMNLVYGKLFGDLDGIESHALFENEEGSDGMHEIEGTAANAEPEMKGSGGVKVTIEPVMGATSEGSKPGKPTMDDHDDDDDDEDDRLKGIGNMSPLMAQLHGSR